MIPSLYTLWGKSVEVIQAREDAGPDLGQAEEGGILIREDRGGGLKETTCNTPRK